MVFGSGSRKKLAPTLGYKTGFEEQYELQQQLGKGGNGVVRLARHKPSGEAQREGRHSLPLPPVAAATPACCRQPLAHLHASTHPFFAGRSFAVKTIPKVLTDPAASERKRADQIPYLRREVEVLLALRGTLNVANLEEVFEDGTHVHLVLELCSGGELLARTRQAGAGPGGKGAPRHYSERTAASFLRACLRTVAQCHAKRIIHRDIKPENVRFYGCAPVLSAAAMAAGCSSVPCAVCCVWVPVHVPRLACPCSPCCLFACCSSCCTPKTTPPP